MLGRRKLTVAACAVSALALSVLTGAALGVAAWSATAVPDD
ncbi:hypothetical protein [Nonomuraea sp. B1E8]